MNVTCGLLKLLDSAPDEERLFLLDYGKIFDSAGRMSTIFAVVVGHYIMKIFAYHKISDIDHDIKEINKGYSLLNAARDCWFACSQDLYDDEKYTIAFLGDLFNLEDLKSKYGHHPTVTEFGYLVNAIKDGTFRIEEHQGSFCLIVYDKEKKRIYVYTDPLGDLYPYYTVTNDFVMISTHMTDFSDSRYFRLNSEWIQHYFKGRDAIGLQTVIEGVSRLRSGHFLIIEGGKATEHKFFDLYDRLQCQLSKPRLKLSVEECTDYFSDIATKNLQAMFKKYKKPVLLLSQGIDSVSVLALMIQAKLPVLSMSRIPDSDYTDDCIDMHRRILEKFPHENHCYRINGDRVFLDLDKSYYIQPDNNTWQTLGIYHKKSVVPSLELGADCMISASMGDYLFLHRTKFLFLYWLSKTDDWERSLEVYRKEFYRNFVGFENDYAYSPQEIDERLLKLFRNAEFDFWRFFTDELHILKGVSHDRDSRLVGKISIIDPFKDTRLFDFFYLIPEDYLLMSMRHSIFQEKMITRVFQEKTYVQKKTNPVAISLIGYKFQDALESDLKKALRLLEELNVETLGYYRSQLVEQRARGTMNLVLCRVLTFYYWYQNWRAADRSPIGFWGSLRNQFASFLRIGE